MDCGVFGQHSVYLDSVQRRGWCRRQAKEHVDPNNTAEEWWEELGEGADTTLLIVTVLPRNDASRGCGSLGEQP